MNFKRKIYFILFLILLLIFSCTKTLEAKEKKYTIGVNTGFSTWPSDIFSYAKIHTPPKDLIHLFTFDKEVSLKNSLNLSLQYYFTPQLGIQGEIGYFVGNYSCILGIIKMGSFETEYEKHDLQWNLKTFFFNIVYEYSKKNTGIIPYNFIGFGLSLISGKKDYRMEIDHKLWPGMKVGAGLRLRPLTNFQLNSRIFILVLDLGIGPVFGWNVETEARGFNFLWGIDFGIEYRF